MTTESRERQQQNKNIIVHNKTDTNHVCSNFSQSRSTQKVDSQKDNTPQQKNILPSNDPTL